jgi:putative Mg2+ transporter-C (MgtC) family protein
MIIPFFVTPGKRGILNFKTPDMYSEMIVRFLLAALWGGIVGIEREYRSKSAGFRTMILISIGSCMFTVLSVLIGGNGNPDRIAANIVTGVGFLGAGVIFRGDNRVNGITTSATIWAVAAIGMAIGGGYYFDAAAASILIIIVLALLPYVETQIDRANQIRNYAIQCVFSDEAIPHYEKQMRHCRLRYKQSKRTKQGSLITINWEVRGKAVRHEQFVKLMLDDQQIQSFEF